MADQEKRQQSFDGYVTYRQLITIVLAVGGALVSGFYAMLMFFLTQHQSSKHSTAASSEIVEVLSERVHELEERHVLYMERLNRLESIMLTINKGK